MIKPAYLKEGDIVRIISTARKIERKVVDDASQLISSWGLKVEYGENLFADHNQYAGTDEERAHDLQKALDESHVKAIFCARGGYGSLRIIDNINFNKFSQSPKWVIGYSDITVLHCHIQKNYAVESIHAPMPLGFEENSHSCLEKLRLSLFGENVSFSFSAHVLDKTGTCSAELIGGNLSILYALQGSNSFPPLKGKILFIEDLDEYLYHLDRMVLSLKRSGTFNELSGLIVGGMTDMNDNNVPFGKSANEIIKEHIDEFDYPVCFDFPAGHIEDNNPLIMGREVRLTVREEENELIVNS